MVDWERVEELRSKGVGWDKIAADSRVGFHADASAGDPGRALRALYHRNRSRIQAKKSSAPSTPSPTKAGSSGGWPPLRILYLLVPLLAIWAALAYFLPSPVGLVVPAVPYLILVAVGVAAIFLFLIWRSGSAPRWSKVYRNTLVGGIVLGLVVSGLIGLTGTLVYGCPVLPSSSSLGSVPNSGWTLVAQQESVGPWSTVPTSAWTSGGSPVYYYYGATWCPYCSASSWAMWKALRGFGQVSGQTFEYSSSTDRFPSTPEVVLAGVTVGPMNGHAPALTWQVSEDTSNVQSTLPGTANCAQQAYVQAYATGIPYVVVNGQWVHDGTLVWPGNLSNYAAGANGGASAVAGSVLNETGAPWNSISFSAWWIMAFLAKASGLPVSTLSNYYGWTPADETAVTHDLSLM
jgi:hypothetical protein